MRVDATACEEDEDEDEDDDDDDDDELLLLLLLLLGGFFSVCETCVASLVVLTLEATAFAAIGAGGGAGDLLAALDAGEDAASLGCLRLSSSSSSSSSCSLSSTLIFCFFEPPFVSAFFTCTLSSSSSSSAPPPPAAAPASSTASESSASLMITCDFLRFVVACAEGGSEGKDGFGFAAATTVAFTVDAGFAFFAGGDFLLLFFLLVLSSSSLSKSSEDASSSDDESIWRFGIAFSTAPFDGQHTSVSKRGFSTPCSVRRRFGASLALSLSPSLFLTAKFQHEESLADDSE